MKDVRRDLHELSRSLERIPSRNGGRQVMVIGANSGEGTSSIAASLALLMSARSSQSTWLVDLDLTGNGQYYGFQARSFANVGLPGHAYDAALNAQPFYQTVPLLRTRNGEAQRPLKMLGVHQIEGTKLFVTRFRSELLKRGQRVQINTVPDFWHNLRKIADWTIVDAPPMDVSRAALAACRHMDGVIIVVRADETRVEQITALRDEIETHGGHCLGVVVNGTKADARFADRFTL